ncbi:hypothetical protein SAMN05519104_4377 [Rhizobiales bacterium GAS188]|nr:hypothetical protein SAMN05519104_4377 [Rhizobiales bacterium GAS188]
MLNHLPDDPCAYIQPCPHFLRGPGIFCILRTVNDCASQAIKFLDRLHYRCALGQIGRNEQGGAQSNLVGHVETIVAEQRF